MSKVSKPDKPVEVFFSYSHKDEELRNELEKHLAILKRQGVIASWHDRKIGAGDEWRGEIDERLNTAHIILLLISADFCNSDYCWDVEMNRAMERHKVREARVIPVILRACDWKNAPFGILQARPIDGKPVTSWPNRDEAFTNVAQGIREAVEELVGKKAVALSPPSKTEAVSPVSAPTVSLQIEIQPDNEKKLYQTKNARIKQAKKTIWKITVTIVVALATIIPVIVYLTGIESFPELMKSVKAYFVTEEPTIPSLIRDIAQINETEILLKRLQAEWEADSILYDSCERFNNIKDCYIFIVDEKHVLAVFRSFNELFYDIREARFVENSLSKFKGNRAICVLLRDDVYKKNK